MWRNTHISQTHTTKNKKTRKREVGVCGGWGCLIVGQNAPIHCIPLGTLGLTGAASPVQTHKDLLLPMGGVGVSDEWKGWE